MKIIVIGNGGREHTIAWKLAQSEFVEEVICSPGNGGTAIEQKCTNINPSNCEYTSSLNQNDAYVEIAKKNDCRLAVIGPENPLAEGLADKFWAAGIPVVGPKKMAAQLEASKDLAKDFMKKYGVACAKSQTFTDKDAALAYVESQGAPIVIKADGLAAGKGVLVAKTLDEAKSAVEELMSGSAVGDAGRKIVVEEYLRGDEISILAAVCVNPEYGEEKVCIVPFLPARDHKRLYDGAKGPNTGGMGAISPVDDVTPLIKSQFEENILKPTLKGLVQEKFDYRGFIFFGIMLTEEGPKCLEYNVRLGDPETQAVLPLMDFDFCKLCESIVDGSLKDFNLSWKKGYCVAPVAVSGGYPKSYKKGFEIKFDEKIINKIGAKVFVAGAIEDRRHHNPQVATKIITSGGRVLACSACGNTFKDAWNAAYEALHCIKFEGMFYRKDIGLPGAAKSE